MGVIVVASVLTATPPPVPPEARAKVEPPTQTQTVADTEVRLSIDPGAAGANSYQVDLSRNGQPLTGSKVALRLVYPLLDRRSSLLQLDDAGDGSYLGAGPELDRAGPWEALIDVATPDQPVGVLPIRAAFRWQVPDTAPNPAKRQPSPLNWLAGGLVVGVLGAWLYPGIRTGLRSIHVQPVILTGAAMAVLVTVVLAVLGAWLLNESAQQTEALRNPPPKFVNQTLPDAESLAAGKAIYDGYCAGCHGPGGAGNGPQVKPMSAPPDFRARLGGKRDEDLFRTIPHANSADHLSETERWNVINYLRSAVFAAPED
jgi:mono/diheme cytochrome c family protein